MKFKKKPVVIDAIQWDGTLSGWRKIENAFPEMRTTSIHYHEGRNEARYIMIPTLENGHDVSNGDYIVRGVKGKFYPRKPDIFEMTYETVADKQLKEAEEKERIQAVKNLIAELIDKVITSINR